MTQPSPFSFVRSKEPKRGRGLLARLLGIPGFGLGQWGDKREGQRRTWLWARNVEKTGKTLALGPTKCRDELKHQLPTTARHFSVFVRFFLLDLKLRAAASSDGLAEIR